MDAAQLITKKPTKPLDLTAVYGAESAGQFTIRTLSGADRIRLTSEGKKNPEEMGVLLVALSLGDKDGNRIFDDSKLVLAKDLPGIVLDTVALHSKDFNYLDQDAFERAKKV